MNNNTDIERLKLIAERLHTTKVDITPTYDDWFHATAACASLGEEAREPYHLICSNYPGYKREECDQKFDNCLHSANGSITLGTLLKMAQDVGIDTTIPTIVTQPAAGGTTMTSVPAATTTLDDEKMTDEDILKLWEGLRITTKTDVPELEPIIKVSYKEEEKDDHKESEVGIFTKRDIHGIKAKQKQGKTTVLKVILAALLLGKMFRLKSCLENPKIFWLDTEQQPSDVKQILTDVSKMTGLSGSEIDEHVNLYPLRSRTYKTLLRELKVNVKAHRPDVVFIDGVVEFVQSFNDEIMSHDLIKEQKILANDCNCAIINVLHENKSEDDENMRGHLGSMLAQAASTVIQCVKSNNGTITAKNSEARHAPMPDWSVKYDDDGCVVDADEQARKERLLKLMSQKERQQAEREERERKRKDAAVQIVRNNGGSITRDELKQKLMAKLELGDSTVQEIIRMCLKSELCMVDGKVCLSPSESQNEPTA